MNQNMAGAFDDGSLLGGLRRHAAELADVSVYTLLADTNEPETLTFAQLSARVRTIAAHLAERLPPEPVAIVGVGCRFPGGVNSLDDLRLLLMHKRSAIREVPADRWNAAELAGVSARLLRMDKRLRSRLDAEDGDVR